MRVFAIFSTFALLSACESSTQGSNNVVNPDEAVALSAAEFGQKIKEVKLAVESCVDEDQNWHLQSREALAFGKAEASRLADFCQYSSSTVCLAEMSASNARVRNNQAPFEDKIKNARSNMSNVCPLASATIHTLLPRVPPPANNDALITNLVRCANATADLGKYARRNAVATLKDLVPNSEMDRWHDEGEAGGRECLEFLRNMPIIRAVSTPKRSLTAQPWLAIGGEKPTIGRCYMSECSWTSEIKRETVDERNGAILLKVLLLGGNSSHESVEEYPDGYNSRIAINWNSKPHSVFILCSPKLPALFLDEMPASVDVLDFINGPPGMLESSARLYWKTCHKADGSESESEAGSMGYTAPKNINITVNYPEEILHYLPE